MAKNTQVDMNNQNQSNSCQLCENRKAGLILAPMEVRDPQTKKTYQLQAICSRCRKILEKTPNRVLWIVAKKCQSCKMPYELVLADRIIKYPRPVSYKGELYKVCEICRKMILKEKAGGATKKIAKLQKKINSLDKKIDKMRDENRQKREKRKKKYPRTPVHSVKKIDGFVKRRDTLTGEKYSFAISHLHLGP